MVEPPNIRNVERVVAPTTIVTYLRSHVQWVGPFHYVQFHWARLALGSLLIVLKDDKLRQVPGLGCDAVAVPDLEPCAIGGAAAGDVEAATRLRVHEAVLVS